MLCNNYGFCLFHIFSKSPTVSIACVQSGPAVVSSILTVNNDEITTTLLKKL